MDIPLSILYLIVLTTSSSLLTYILILCLLLFLSAAMSASEVSFFSITRKEIDELDESSRRRVSQILEKPKRLLATVLIANNAVNLTIVIVAGFILEIILPESIKQIGWANFLIQVVAVTFIILLFGEILPKVYATQSPKKITKIMVTPMSFLNKGLVFISTPLMWSSSLFEKKNKPNQSLSVDDLEAVIELTNDKNVSDEEKKIWKGIVEFGTISVKETMKPRVDVVAIDIDSSFGEVMSVVLQAGYSRLPVYKNTLDTIEGILYIKDLIPYIDANKDFDWNALIRPTYFVPENKKIDDLLKEFQEKKMHIAIVVDEYGGASGIVTLEDIIEEIVGEINDEFDDEEIVYSKLDENNFVLEGKTTLINLCRILNIEYHTIEDYVGDSDTIAGLLLQINGNMPEQNQIIDCGFLRFKVESVDKKRIKRVKVTKRQTVNNEE